MFVFFKGGEFNLPIDTLSVSMMTDNLGVWLSGTCISPEMLETRMLSLSGPLFRLIFSFLLFDIYFICI